MGQQIQKNKEYKVQDLFDKILEQHMKRLVGTGHEIGELPMTSAVISCLMLLMERENEIENSNNDSFERYTAETLISELDGIGFDLDQNVKKLPQEMIQKGYIHVDGDGRFLPEKPAKSMVQLLDQLFPGMPGMNFIAYLVQTIDEIKSERKDLNSAVSQLDQMLHMQGVPLKKEQLRPEPVKVSPQQAEQKSKIKTTQKKEGKGSDIRARRISEKYANGARMSSSEPRILSFAELKDKFEVREVHFGTSLSKKDESIEAIYEPPSDLSSDQMEGLKIKDEKITNECPESSTENLKKDHPAQLKEEMEEDVLQVDEDDERLETESKNDPDISSETEFFDTTDDDIERRITTFEEDLSLECPICRRSKIRNEETKMGKSYYRCSSKTCIFISWGKPYHIPCPTCNNPFLVETSGKDVKTILKCPRATCRYRQGLPLEGTDNEVAAISRKPRRKVVKRRRVRRKK